MRGCACSVVKMVVVSAHRLPTATITCAQPAPWWPNASASGACGSMRSKRTMSVSTADTATYSTVTMTSDAMTPMGKSRFGFFASSAEHATASKPTNAKNTMAVPPSTPSTPYGRKLAQLGGSMNAQPAPMQKSTATSVITTTTLFMIEFTLAPIATTIVSSVSMMSAKKLSLMPSGASTSMGSGAVPLTGAADDGASAAAGSVTFGCE
mmetsp:Transcript_21623/g.52773  ORF Transcript_21623/g.52773 Transcript_21623/m.52773 type:complete len:209 (+) Transcript_21623:263-889(+)